MNKRTGYILSLLVVCSFLIYFIPLWYDGISRSRLSQMCRLNKTAAQWEVDAVIVGHSLSKTNGGYVDFELLNGKTYPMMEWVFNNQLDSIVPGDRILKKKGELIIEVSSRNKKLQFSLDHGCPEWSSIR